jgi:hypothetical protein
LNTGCFGSRLVTGKELTLFAVLLLCVCSAVLLQLPAPVGVLLSHEHQQHDAGSDAVSDSAASLSSGTIAKTDAASDNGMVNQQDTTAQQQPEQQQQQLALISRSTLVQLMQRCNGSEVRQQAYCAGLLPRLEEAAALLDELARYMGGSSCCL